VHSEPAHRDPHVAAAGRYAAFIWGGGGDRGYVRIAVRRF